MDGGMVSGEAEIKKLLKIRGDLEARVARLQEEIADTQKAMAEIDRAIVGQGFRNSGSAFKPASTIEPQKPKAKPREPKPAAPAPAEDDAQQSVQAKDGTILGTLQGTESTVVFTPKPEFSFTTSTPPFQSFLIERVLQNMKQTDEQKAATGDLSPDQILDFTVETEGETIKSVTVRNFGGERRLREIQSSFRWSFDKMYDKMRRG
jgi:hypothetical protein